MTRISDHYNQNKKKLAGVALLLFTFLLSWKWSFFHNSKPRHKTMLFILNVSWFSNNLMQKMTSITPSMQKIVHLKIKYLSEIWLQNLDDFQGFSQFYQRPGQFRAILSICFRVIWHIFWKMDPRWKTFWD